MSVALPQLGKAELRKLLAVRQKELTDTRELLAGSQKELIDTRELLAVTQKELAALQPTASSPAPTDILWDGTFTGETDMKGTARPLRNLHDPQIYLRQNKSGVSVTFALPGRKSVTLTMKKEKVKPYMVAFFLSGRLHGWLSKFPEEQKTRVKTKKKAPKKKAPKKKAELPVAASAQPDRPEAPAFKTGSGSPAMDADVMLDLLIAADRRPAAAKAAPVAPVAVQVLPWVPVASQTLEERQSWLAYHDEKAASDSGWKRQRFR